MNTKYHERLSIILIGARPRLTTTHDLEFKSCFGAVAGYVRGEIFVSCGKFGLALKLPPGLLEKLFEEKGVVPLKYFEKGHVKKNYAVLPKRILEDKERLKKLIDASIRFAVL